MLFVPFMKSIRKVSIRGRCALGLRGCELLAEKKGISSPEHAGALDAAWEFTSEKDYSYWETGAAFCWEYDFGDAEVTGVFHRALDIAAMHSYGSADEYGEMQCVHAMWDILDTLQRHGILLESVKKLARFAPSFSLFRFFSSKEMDMEWGRLFTREEILPRIEYSCGVPVRERITL